MLYIYSYSVESFVTSTSMCFILDLIRIRQLLKVVDTFQLSKNCRIFVIFSLCDFPHNSASQVELFGLWKLSSELCCKFIINIIIVPIVLCEEGIKKEEEMRKYGYQSMPRTKLTDMFFWSVRPKHVSILQGKFPSCSRIFLRCSIGNKFTVFTKK